MINTKSIYIKICLLHSCASTSASGQKVEVSLFYMLLGCDKESVTGRISLSFDNPNTTAVKNGDAS
ncbi:hypothetical protein HID58_079323 [Brassica napus]|uniref:Uncharacterized protein n=1 Tax=Brassica napus TaxID=3708 RepID=A0ABQ7Y1P6_BRANA|nr:hypothetical protein HID58_079323 [Brassica napus]